MEQIVIESDSLVSVKAINGETNLPGLITNIVKDINIMTKVVKDIKFVYYSKQANILADMLAKNAHSVCT